MITDKIAFLPSSISHCPITGCLFS